MKNKTTHTQAKTATRPVARKAAPKSGRMGSTTKAVTTSPVARRVIYDSPLKPRHLTDDELAMMVAKVAA